MTKRTLAGAVGVLALAVAALASEAAADLVLRAYGPGGPHRSLQECADLFGERHGITVGILKASPAELPRKLRADGDIYYTGAEYMLDDFVRENPTLLDLETAREIQPRRVGILVRKGNPLGIEGVDCLREKNARFLSARLEHMEPFFEPSEGETLLVPHLVYSGMDGVRAWRARPEIDAWITYKSWHVWLEEESDFVELSCGHALRHTMIALTRTTPHREAAHKFLAFLEGEEAQEIFRRHGWE